ncbi:hypothetical protein L1987_02134 [Smallanthus sonchifolius]|uniref:Uncharacterized protein n=1 Tax=Smallanthus sonchifolius TaxID=185202 RepID=A0ACB9K769_9ASTR|nr:hypothetical protein L1987_02134 [Smallanthus sonchifolius]
MESVQGVCTQVEKCTRSVHLGGKVHRELCVNLGGKVHRELCVHLDGKVHMGLCEHSGGKVHSEWKRAQGVCTQVEKCTGSMHSCGKVHRAFCMHLGEDSAYGTLGCT